MRACKALVCLLRTGVNDEDKRLPMRSTFVVSRNSEVAVEICVAWEYLE
jgi:hypothetical protein